MSPFDSLLKNALLPVITNLKYFFHKDFIKENYISHFGVSLVLTFLSIHLLTMYCYLGITPILFQLVIGYLGAYIVNYLREFYYNKIKGYPFSYIDVIFGGYGGFTGTSIYLIIT